MKLGNNFPRLRIKSEIGRPRPRLTIGICHSWPNMKSDILNHQMGSEILILKKLGNRLVGTKNDSKFHLWPGVENVTVHSLLAFHSWPGVKYLSFDS